MDNALVVTTNEMWRQGKREESIAKLGNHGGCDCGLLGGAVVGRRGTTTTGTSTDDRGPTGAAGDGGAGVSARTLTVQDEKVQPAMPVPVEVPTAPGLHVSWDHAPEAQKLPTAGRFEQGLRFAVVPFAATGADVGTEEEWRRTIADRGVLPKFSCLSKEFEKRPIAVAFVGTARPHFRERTMLAWGVEYARKSINHFGKLTKISLRAGADGDRVALRSTNSAKYLLDLYQNSKFCLILPGDTGTPAKRLADVVHSGCVPVFFWHVDSYPVVPSWISRQEWERGSLFFPIANYTEAGLALVDLVRAAEKNRVPKWMRTGRRVVHEEEEEEESDATALQQTVLTELGPKLAFAVDEETCGGEKWSATEWLLAELAERAEVRDRVLLPPHLRTERKLRSFGFEGITKTELRRRRGD